MKKYLIILLTLAMTACSVEPTEPEVPTPPPVEPPSFAFILNAHGVYNLGTVEIQLVDTVAEGKTYKRGDIVNTSDDTVVYEYKKEYTDTRALYMNKANKYNIVEYKDDILVFLGEFTTPEESDTAHNNGTVLDPSPDTPIVTPIVFELEDGVYDLPNDRTVTVTQVDGKPSISEVRNTILYTYVKAFGTSQGIFVNAAGQYVGIQKSDTTPPTLSLYAKDKNPRDTWTTAREVSFTEVHLYVINPDEPKLPEGTPAFIMSAYDLFPITLAGITYTMDKNGDLSVDGTILYIFKEAPESSKAIYTTADSLTFLGAQIVSEEFALYLKNKITPWDTQEEVLYTDRHRVGFVPAFVISAQAKQPFTIDGTDNTAYTMDNFGDIFIKDGAIAYTLLAIDNDTLADYAVAGATDQFVGFGVPSDANLMHLYKHNKRTPWTTQNAITHTDTHRVGFVPAFVISAQAKQPFTIDGTDNTAYTMDNFGDIFIKDGAIAYTLLAIDNDTLADYAVAGATDQFVGFGVPSDANLMHLYKNNKRTPWTTQNAITHTDTHKVGLKSAFVIAAQAKQPFTIDGTDDTAYTMDNLGDILDGSLEVVYTHLGIDDATTAEYAVTGTTDQFVGFGVPSNANLMHLYKNNKRTPWTTREEIQYTVAHQVGLKTAFVTVAQAKGEFTIFGVENSPTYTMNDLGDIYVKDGNMAYSNIGDHANATNSYYVPMSADTKFAGFGIPEGSTSSDKILHLYKDSRTVYFNQQTDVNFIKLNLVGDSAVAVPFKDWDNYGTINSGLNKHLHFSTASYGNIIWIVGGYPNGDDGKNDLRSKDIYKSVDAGKNWEKIVPKGLNTVNNAALVATSPNNLVLMGGAYDRPAGTSARIYTSSDGGRNWTRGANYDGGSGNKHNDNTTTKPRRVNGATLVFHKNKQYLIGGVGKYWENFVWSSEDNKTWTRVTSATETGGVAINSFPVRAFHAAVSFNEDLYVIGGHRMGPNETYSDVWRSKDDGKTWTKILDNAPWGKRTGLQAVVFNNEIYIVGGTTVYGTVSEADPKKLIWKSADGVNWTAVEVNTDKIGARTSFGAAAVTSEDGNKLDFVIFGGKRQNDTWRTGNYVNPKG